MRKLVIGLLGANSRWPAAGENVTGMAACQWRVKM